MQHFEHSTPTVIIPIARLHQQIADAAKLQLVDDLEMHASDFVEFVRHREDDEQAIPSSTSNDACTRIVPSIILHGDDGFGLGDRSRPETASGRFTDRSIQRAFLVELSSTRFGCRRLLTILRIGKTDGLESIHFLIQRSSSGARPQVSLHALRNGISRSPSAVQ